MDWPPNSSAILSAIQERFQAGDWWIYKGDTARQFEHRFAEAHDCKYGVSVCNGTVALDIILRALGIGPGDEVVLPAYNFYSLPKSVSNVGATSVFVDVCEDNLTIDANQVRDVVRSGPKAVVAVHISGSVAKLDELSDICRSAGVYLIEDCAQATGARYAGRRVGSWGHVGLFSFGGIKLMTCGQGGMITTSDPEIYDKCYAIANRGQSPAGELNTHGIIGDNYQMSELSAVILGPQLDILEELCAQRERIMVVLDCAIGAVDGLTPLKQFAGTTYRAQMRYSFLYDASRFPSMSQTQFIQCAHKSDIPLMVGYRSVSNDVRLFQAYAANTAYPVAQAAQDRVLSIHHTDLSRGTQYWEEAIGRLESVLTAEER